MKACLEKYTQKFNDIVNIKCPINIKDTKQFKIKVPQTSSIILDQYNWTG